jgi:imidazole glycerol-phosphate synthase subunit HisH
MTTMHILDYGVGNIGSLNRLFRSLGLSVVRATTRDQIAATPLLLLPGVGSAVTALERIHALGLSEPLRARYAAGKPILGICLGAQLVFSTLAEAGEAEGLGFLPGRVAPLHGSPSFHTGWSPLDHDQLTNLGLARALRPGDSYFFNHQYVCPPSSVPRQVPVGTLTHVPALYLAGHLVGIQFHPEKSQGQGRTLVRNILEDHYGL